MTIEYHLLDSTYTAVLITSATGQILWANQSSEKLFSTSHKRLKLYNIAQIIRPIHPENLKISQSNTVNPLKTETSTETKIDQPFLLKPIIHHEQWVAGINQPVYVDYSISVFVNTFDKHLFADSDQKSQKNYLIELWTKDRQHQLTQEQQQQSQYKMARNMLRAVAHEVKNPLAGIRGATQLLERLLQKTPLLEQDNKASIYTDIIINETDRLTQLISQLLGNHQLPTLQPINLHQPIEHVLTLIESQQQNINIIRDYDLSLPEVMADQDQLIQIFLNIANNAIQAMLDRYQSEDINGYQATLTISTRVEFQRTIVSHAYSDISDYHISTHSPSTVQSSKLHKKIAKIIIQDNGVGIPEHMLEQIFFPLVTGRADGTGLGLSLVHEMIQRHQGQVEVSSHKGDTQFMVYLPFA